MLTEKHDDFELHLQIDAAPFRDTLSQLKLEYDRGLPGVVADALSLAISAAIQKELGNELIKKTIDVNVGGAESLAYIRGNGGAEISQIALQIDVLASRSISAIKFSHALVVGRHQFDRAWDGLVRITKHSMKTRDRYRVRAYSFLVPAVYFQEPENISPCACPPNWLYVAPDQRFRQIIWVCGGCGKRYTCSCIFDAANQNSDPAPVSRDAICHLCRNIPSTITYEHPMYGGSRTRQHHRPYIDAIMHRDNVSRNEAENKVRSRLGIPDIGDGWIVQAELYRTIKSAFPDEIVEREASPSWLGRQRYDIFLPRLMIAVEYNGEQHFAPVSIFGGEAGHLRTVERDEEKRKKSTRAGVTLIELGPADDLSLKAVRLKITNAIASSAATVSR